MDDQANQNVDKNQSPPASSTELPGSVPPTQSTVTPVGVSPPPVNPSAPAPNTESTQTMSESPQVFTSPSTQPHASSGNKKLIVIIGAVVGLLAIGAVAAFALASGKDDKKAASQTSSVAPLDSLEEESSERKSNPVVTSLEKRVTTDHGYSITAHEMVTGYIPEHEEEDVDIFLFKLTIAEESTPQYTGMSPQKTGFVLVVDGQEVTASQHYTGASRQDLADAGYTELEIKTVKTGDPNMGYIQIGVPKGKKPTALRYKQKEAKVLGSSSSLPAKDYDIVL